MFEEEIAEPPWVASGAAPPAVPAPPRIEGPARLLLYAAGWLILALMTPAILTLCVSFVILVHNAATHSEWPLPRPTAVALPYAICGELVLLWAAWRRARIVGQGDWRAGLGLGPIQGAARLVAFTLIPAFVFAQTILPLLAGRVAPLRPGEDIFVTALGFEVPTAIHFVGVALLVVVLGPLAEEFFYRGWLWTGLSRYWWPTVVMVVTSLPWLASHFFGTIGRPASLIPLAIILSITRYVCDSVRASLVVHVFNNILAMGLLTFLALHR